MRLFPGRKRLGQVEDRVSQLARDLEDLKAENDRIRLQAKDLYESAHRLHDKIRKRASRDAAPETGQDPVEDLNYRIREGLPIATTS